MELAPQRILIEPDGRNTAPAILAAAFWMAQKDRKALMLVTPSYHLIPQADAFRETVQAAVPRAQEGDLVTFGITSTRPETGSGYLELAAGSDAQADTPQALARFIEKPEAARAADMVAAGNFLWNAGIFLFTAETLIAADRVHAPDLLAAVEAALKDADTDLGFTRIDP